MVVIRRSTRGRGLVLATALTGLSWPGLATADQLVIDDPLTSAGGPPKQVEGGTFSAAGWTRDGFQSKIIYDFGAPITRGRLTFEMNGVNGFDHGVGGMPPCRAIFAGLDEDGSGDLGVQNIWVWAMDDTVICNGADEPPYRTNRMKLLVRTEVEPAPGEPMTEELDWDPQQFYAYEVTWDHRHATLTRNGVLLLDQVYPSGSLAMNLRYLFLGTIHRYDAGVREATFRNLQVWDLDDAGGACLQAVSLDPSNGAGDEAVFRAVYSHCEGAQTFRIVQIWFGDEVAIDIPHTGGHFEDGMFSWDGQLCTPGQAVKLYGEYSTFDCERSTVTTMGDQMIVEYAVEFDVDAFGGPRNIFFDAKGGAGDPEPRLGWTQVGTYTVQPFGADPEATGDGDGGSGGAGSGASDGSGSGGTGLDSGLYVPPERETLGGCQCRADGGAGPADEGSSWLAWLVLASSVRRRARRRARAMDPAHDPLRA